MGAPLILYGMNSPNVRKVVLMLEELALPYALAHVAVFKGEQFTPEFRALNPLAKVPALLDPALGQPLAESAAILVYLGETHGRFLPADYPARAEVMQWLMVQMASGGPMLGQLNHFRSLPQDEQAESLYRLLDERLAGREWIAGGAYSIADMAIYPWAHYLEKHGFDPAAFPALIRWRAAIDARPATARAAQRMDEAFAAISAETRKAATKADLDRFFGRTDTMPPADYSAITR